MELEQKELDDISVQGGRQDESDDGREKSFKITVVYNGLTKPLTVERDELIKSVLDRAIAAFGSPPNPHMLSLFNEKGEELRDGDTVKKAKVKKGDSLLLRPSKVKAG